MAEGFEFQEKFVAQLKAVVAPNISLADELSDLLNVSTDSIYRRLRCQSNFSFDEIALICKRFDISLDGLLNSNSLQVTFNFNPLYEDKGNFEKYLHWFAQYLSDLANIPGSKIIYAADDVPPFRHFAYPNLSAFKSYYWSKAVLNYDTFAGRKFNPDLIPKENIEISKKAFEAYTRIDSIEIWTEETLTSTLKQVEFYWESDLFETQELVLTVVGEIRQMMEELKQECVTGFKNDLTKKGAFTLYNSDVMIGNNCVLIEPGDAKFPERVFLGNNTFNTISTYNSAFKNETRLWMENLTKKSLLLSGSGEKQRARFFKKIDDKINTLEMSIRNTAVSS